MAAWRRLLDSVVKAVGDSVEIRQWRQACLAFDPGTIELPWWEDLFQRCRQGPPEAFNQVCSDIASLVKLIAEPEQKAEQKTTPPLPKWSYSDGCGNLISSRTSKPMRTSFTVLPG